MKDFFFFLRLEHNRLCFHKYRWDCSACSESDSLVAFPPNMQLKRQTDWKHLKWLKRTKRYGVQFVNITLLPTLCKYMNTTHASDEMNFSSAMSDSIFLADWFYLQHSQFYGLMAWHCMSFSLDYSQLLVLTAGTMQNCIQHNTWNYLHRYTATKAFYK